MIITISGDIGSGKSTVGRALMKEFKYEYLSTGSIQRKIAEEMGITTLELNILSENLPEVDDRIDAHTIALNEAEKNYIVDSRLAWHFIPSSFKVYLKCRTDEAARRISKDKSRSSEKKNQGAGVLLTKILERRASEKRRFIHKYGVDYTELHQYDVVLDTSDLSREEAINQVKKHFLLWQSI